MKHAIKQYDTIFLTLGLLLIYSLYLGAHPLINPEEARYTSISVAMLRTHDWITPHLMGAVFFDKPPLAYWLQAISAYLFGVNTFALRLPVACVSVLGIVYNYFFCKKIFNRYIAFTSAIILATMPLYFALSHFCSMDIEVAVCIQISILSFFLGYRQWQANQNNYSYFIISYLFAALGFLCKGLIALAFPACIYFIFIAINRQWALLKKCHLILGICIILLITLPWLIAVQLKYPSFLYYFFIFEQFTRYSASVFNNPNPFWFYVPIIIASMGWWLPYLATITRIKTIKPLKSNLQNQALLLFILWFVFCFIFFSIPKSKTIGYASTMLAPLAGILSCCYYYHQSKKTTPWIDYLTNVLIILFSLGLTIGYKITANQFFHFDTITFAASCLLSILFITVFVCALRQHRPQTFLHYVCLASSLGLIIQIQLLAADTNIAGSSYNIIQHLPKTFIKHTYFMNFENHNFDSSVYLNKTIPIVTNWEPIKKDITADTDTGHIAWACAHDQQSCKNMLTYADLKQRWANKQKNVCVFSPNDTNTLAALHKLVDKTYVIESNPWLQLICNHADIHLKNQSYAI